MAASRAAEAQLQKLAESLDAPVIQTVNARGAMHGHRLCVPASPSLTSVRNLIAAADQILAIGTELGPTDYDVYAKGGVPDLSDMIRIDICADQLARHPAKMPIKADAGPMMAALLPMTHAAPTATAPPGPKPRGRPHGPNLPRLSDRDARASLTMVEAIRDRNAGRDHRRRQHPAGLCREPLSMTTTAPAAGSTPPPAMARLALPPVPPSGPPSPPPARPSSA